MGIPDQNIHPTATGEAAKIVAAHTKETGGKNAELTFYSGWFCPFVQRTWITLEERGIPYLYKEVNPYKKEPHFLEINPKGLVPAVEWKGKALYESLVLCEFLEDAYPNYPNKVLPESPFDRALVRLWTDFISKSILPAWFRLLQAQEAEAQEKARNDLSAALLQWSSQIRGDPWFLPGENWSLVDIALAPFAARFYILQEHRGLDPRSISPKFAQWYDAAVSRPSVKNTTSDLEHYVEIYGRYLRNEAQSEAAKATREGKVIP